MKELSRRNLLGLAAVAPLAAMLRPNWAAGVTAAQATLEARERIHRLYFPDVPLLTQDNQKVRLYDDLVKDKIATINFFYARCEGICPLVMTNLVRVQKLLGKRVGREINMISITLKPEQDTPAALKEYAAMHGVKPGWTFLTGKPEDIERLRRSLGFTNPEPQIDQDKSQHIGNVRYGNEPLMEWSAFPGMSKPEYIVESISWVYPTAKS